MIFSKEQLQNFFFFVFLQLPLLYKLSLWDLAFGFFYIGFPLMLPNNKNKIYTLIIAFFTGLLIDIFTNTYGIHAFSTVFVMFYRNRWLNRSGEHSGETVSPSIDSLGSKWFLFFIFPLIFIHHFLVFFIENGGFHFFGRLLAKVILSTILTGIIVFVIHVLLAPKRKKRIW